MIPFIHSIDAIDIAVGFVVLMLKFIVGRID